MVVHTVFGTESPSCTIERILSKVIGSNLTGPYGSWVQRTCPQTAAALAAQMAGWDSIMWTKKHSGLGAGTIHGGLMAQDFTAIRAAISRVSRRGRFLRLSTYGTSFLTLVLRRGLGGTL